MSFPTRFLQRAGAMIAAAIAMSCAGCSKAEWMGRQSAMDPAGPICQMQFDVFMDTVWLTLVLFVLVGGAFVIAVVRFREKPEDAGKPVAKQGHGNPLIEIGIIMLSVGALVFIATPTLKGVWLMYDDAPEETYFLNGDPTEHKVSAKESALKNWFPYVRDTDGVENYTVKTDAEPLRITVIGKQWWFRFEYPQFGLEHGGGAKRSVSNEFVIPVGRRVELLLRSEDVIHSFWLPKIAGKVDLVPGRRNEMWIQADKPGNYYGQCAEYCGESHAYMLFRCRAVSDAEFKAWIGHQLSPAAEPAGELATEGKQLFAAKSCTMCHTIGGTAAAGAFGPDLTHLASRTTLAGAWLFNYDDTKHKAAEDAARNTFVVPAVDKSILKENLIKWIGSSGMNHAVTDGLKPKNYGDVKPGNRMHYYNGMFGVTGLQAGLKPDAKGDRLTEHDLKALAEYLAGLE